MTETVLKAYDQHTYDHYLDRMAGVDVPLKDGEPYPGFYRMRRREKMGPLFFVPVAYFMEGDKMVCVAGDQEIGEQRSLELWTSCQPIAEDVWRAVAERGEPWPDIDAYVHGQNIKAGDDIEALTDQIDSALKGLSAYDKITSDDERDRAQTLRSRLLELSTTADRKRVTEKAPHLAAEKAVDAVWQPLVKRAKVGADTIRAAMNAWENEKAQKRAAAEEENRRAMKMAGIPEGIGMDAPPPDTQRPIKGAYGRAASVRTVKRAEIVDQDVVYEVFKARNEVHNVLQHLAQIAVEDGIEVPGIKVVEEKRVS